MWCCMQKFNHNWKIIKTAVASQFLHKRRKATIKTTKNKDYKKMSGRTCPFRTAASSHRATVNAQPNPLPIASHRLYLASAKFIPHFQTFYASPQPAFNSSSQPLETTASCTIHLIAHPAFLLLVYCANTKTCDRAYIYPQVWCKAACRPKCWIIHSNQHYR